MKKAFTTTYFIFYFSCSFAQSPPKEFEGRKHYKNTFIIKQSVIDSLELVKSLGASSIYSYKTGKFLWRSYGSDFQYELWDSQTGIVVDKYGSSDTLQTIDVFKKADSLISYKITRNADKICGYICDAIQVEIQTFPDKSIMKRTIFYSSQLYVNPEHFKKYRSYANYQIYPITKSVPLRLVTEYEGLPVVIIINAEKVELVKIDDDEFKPK